MSSSQILSDVDIKHLCLKFKINLIACVSKDLLKTLQLKSGCYIINLQNSFDGGGTHWVALYIRGNDGLYFDSFGIKYPVEIQQFCRNINLEYNETQIQNINQYSCGWYCLAFLHFCEHNVIKTNPIKFYMNKFINMFDNMKFSVNDNILQQYIINKILKKFNL